MNVKHSRDSVGTFRPGGNTGIWRHSYFPAPLGGLDYKIGTECCPFQKSKRFWALGKFGRKFFMTDCKKIGGWQIPGEFEVRRF